MNHYFSRPKGQREHTDSITFLCISLAFLGLGLYINLFGRLNIETKSIWCCIFFYKRQALEQLFRHQICKFYQHTFTSLKVSSTSFSFPTALLHGIRACTTHSPCISSIYCDKDNTLFPFLNFGLTFYKYL
jgi:hypothetical protein